MSEYIEREAAMAAACKALCHPGVLCPDFKCAEVRDAFNAIPAADFRPVVRGEWRLGGYGQISDATEKWYDKFLVGGFLYCSVCKGRTSVKYNFCPNCGAMMEES